MKCITLLRALIVSAVVASCASTGTEPSRPGARTYRMGFSSLPPRLTVQEVLRTVDSLTNHSDAALMVIDVPWVALLADSSPSVLIRRDQYPLALRYQQRGLPLVATLDVTNGLNRSAEHDALVTLGRSITEPAVQRAYREYVVAFDSILHPRYLALAMETNLVRTIAPSAVYAAVVTMTNAAAQQLRAAGSTTQLMVSVQVETAWGRLPAGSYVGIQRDRTDFPFVQAIGLSSYPYLAGFTAPEQLPIEYYSRLVADAPLPMLVVEGGWTSGSVTGVTSSPVLQARYIRRQMQIADAAKLVGVFQITMTDFDMASYPVPAGSILPLFAQLGLLDVNYRPKPALAVWDSVRAVALSP
ncbi:MAG: hypothetical protein ABIT20_24775 [Gemmatimonadaceae bacterium]